MRMKKADRMLFAATVFLSVTTLFIQIGFLILGYAADFSLRFCISASPPVQKHTQQIPLHVSLCFSISTPMTHYWITVSIVSVLVLEIRAMNNGKCIL